MAGSQHYPRLQDFIHGWFHQDFDIEGDVPEIVRKHAAAVTASEREALRAEIRAFLSTEDGDANAAFIRVFTPDIDPAGWGMSARQWLEWICRLLTDA